MTGEKEINGSVKHPGGRPTKYKKEYGQMAEEMIRYAGFSIAKLAKIFKVQPKTIHNWMGGMTSFYIV